MIKVIYIINLMHTIILQNKLRLIIIMAKNVLSFRQTCIFI